MNTSGKVRLFHTKFFDDPFIIDLEPITRSIYMYILLSPLNNVAGVYEIHINTIMQHTGWTKNNCIDSINKLMEAGKIIRIDNWMIITNHLRYQETKSPLTRSGIKSYLDMVPTKVLARFLYAPCMELNRSLYFELLSENKTNEISAITQSDEFKPGETVSPIQGPTKGVANLNINNNNKDIDKSKDGIPEDQLVLVDRLNNLIEENKYRIVNGRNLPETAQITSKEMYRLIQEFGYVFTESGIKKLYSYMGSNKKQYAKENLAFRNWVVPTLMKEGLLPNPGDRLLRLAPNVLMTEEEYKERLELICRKFNYNNPDAVVLINQMISRIAARKKSNQVQSYTSDAADLEDMIAKWSIS